MKKVAVLLALSLAANLALVATWFIRPRAPETAAAIRPVNTASAASTVRLDTTQLAALNSGDAAQLRAAGFPEETVRWLSVGRAFASLQARMKILRPTTETNDKYWKTSPYNSFQNRTKEQRAEMAKVQREFSETLRSAFGEDAAPWGADSRLAFLPASKREQLRQIDQDYSEMQSEIYSDMNGIQLASDREKLKLLQQEKERDLAAVLSPEEMEQYNLRVSPTAMNLRGRYGDAIQTEEDYRKVYALQKAFDDKYATPDFRSGPPNADQMRARSEAERALRDQIRAVIGEENYAAFQRANDQSYKALTSLVKRLDLPATTIDTVYASRDGYAAQSQQIAQNTALPSAERRNQLQALATKARTELESTLGKEGAEAYAQRADWLRMLTNGTGFSTDPKMAPPGYSSGGSVYPVPPKNDSKANPPRT